MVYVSSDGSLTSTTPWTKWIFGLFFGFFNMIIMFFRTLINPDMAGKRQAGYYSGTSGNSRPGSGPPYPPRRIGRINGGTSVDVPFMGGCSSCAR